MQTRLYRAISLVARCVGKDAALQTINAVYDGGKGSGNFGHKGRIGKRGGSAKISGFALFEDIKRMHELHKKDQWFPRSKVYEGLLRFRNEVKNESGGNKESDDAPLVQADYDYLIQKISNRIHSPDGQFNDEVDELEVAYSKNCAMRYASQLLSSTGNDDISLFLGNEQHDADLAEQQYWKECEKEARDIAEFYGKQFDEQYWKRQYDEFDRDKYIEEWRKDPNVHAFVAKINGKYVTFSDRQAKALSRLWYDNSMLENTSQVIENDPQQYDILVRAVQKALNLPPKQTEQQEKMMDAQFKERALDQQEYLEQKHRTNTRLGEEQYKKSLEEVKKDINAACQRTLKSVQQCKDSKSVLQALRQFGVFRDVQHGIVKDVDVAKGMATSLVDNMKRFPFMVGFVQTLSHHSKGLLDTATAYYVYKTKSICTCTAKDLDNKTLEQQYKESEESLFHPPTDKTTSYTVFTHEFGHAVDHFMRTKGIDTENILKMSLKQNGISVSNVRYLTYQEKNDITDNIGKYAAKDECELFAELFAQAYTSNAPRKCALSFRRMLEQQIAKHEEEWSR